MVLVGCYELEKHLSDFPTLDIGVQRLDCLGEQNR